LPNADPETLQRYDNELDAAFGQAHNPHNLEPPYGIEP
jgi:hypothetical protein